jgi:hypothetical protein
VWLLAIVFCTSLLLRAGGHYNASLFHHQARSKPAGPDLLACFVRVHTLVTSSTALQDFQLEYDPSPQAAMRRFILAGLLCRYMLTHSRMLVESYYYELLFSIMRIIQQTYSGVVELGHTDLGSSSMQAYNQRQRFGCRWCVYLRVYMHHSMLLVAAQWEPRILLSCMLLWRGLAASTVVGCRPAIL